MRRTTIVLDGSDNVASALVDLEAGQEVTVFTPGSAPEMVRLRQVIPLGHKFALVAIPLGGEVVKHGLPVGLATRDIGKGEHVHMHNVTGEGLDSSAGDRTVNLATLQPDWE